MDACLKKKKKKRSERRDGTSVNMICMSLKPCDDKYFIKLSAGSPHREADEHMSRLRSGQNPHGV